MPHNAISEGAVDLVLSSKELNDLAKQKKVYYYERLIYSLKESFSGIQVNDNV